LPTEEEWPGIAKRVQHVYPQGLPARGAGKHLGSLENFFESLPETSQTILADFETIEILKFMLQICPKKRPTCKEVLAHKYFDDLSPDFKLKMSFMKESKEDIIVDLDEKPVLGKRDAALLPQFVDLDQDPTKRPKLV